MFKRILLNQGFKTLATITALVTILATIGFFAPRKNQSEVSAAFTNNCVGAKATPTLNPFPVVYTAGQDCSDYPLIRGVRKLADGTDYPQSAAEYNSGLTLNAGETARVLMYVHNGAAVNLPESQTTAKNVVVSTSWSNTPSTQHIISASAKGDNTAAVSGSYKIKTPQNTRLEVIPNTGAVATRDGVAIVSGQNIGNNSYTLGNVKACFAELRFIAFDVRVVAANPDSYNSECAGDTLPSTIKTGNQITGTVSVKNTGNTTWSTSYKLHVVSNNTNYFVPVTGSVAPGATAVFNVTVPAQASAGSQNISFRMNDGTNDFGSTCSKTVTVNTDVPNAQSNAACVSNTVPTTMTTNGTYSATVTVKNTGNTTWTNAYRLVSTNSTFGNINVPVTGTVAPGANVTFTVALVAPVAAGTYTTAFRVSDSNGQFGDTCNVSITVNSNVNSGDLDINKEVRNVTGNTAFQKSVRAKTGDRVEYRVTVSGKTNTAYNARFTDSLPSGVSFVSGTVKLDGTQIADNSLTGYNLGTITAGQTKTFLYQANVVLGQISTEQTITNTGSTTFTYSDGSNTQTRSSMAYVVVDPQITNTNNNGECVSLTTLDNVNAGQTFSVNATLRNTGNTTWFSGYKIVPTGNNNFGVSPVYLNSNVQPGQSVSVVFNVTAPNNTGSYQLSYQLNDGTNNFGGVCSKTIQVNQVVTNNGYLRIDKQVRNVVTNSGFSKTTTARSGDRVEYRVTYSTYSGSVSNVNVSDTLPAGFTLDSGSARLDGSVVADSVVVGQYNLGSFYSGQTRTLIFSGIVNNYGGASYSNIVNTALATYSDSRGYQNTVSDQASVIINAPVVNQPSNLQLSKSAWNDTKNVDAAGSVASREDFITYKLTVTNPGNTAYQSYVISDDLSGILALADIVDKGNGNLNGNVLSFPAELVPAGGSITKTFRVRVKFSLAGNLSYQMKNTFGNTVTVTINTPPVYEAPRTGSAAVGAIGLGTLLSAVAGFVTRRKKN